VNMRGPSINSDASILEDLPGIYFILDESGLVVAHHPSLLVELGAAGNSMVYPEDEPLFALALSDACSRGSAQVELRLKVRSPSIANPSYLIEFRPVGRGDKTFLCANGLERSAGSGASLPRRVVDAIVTAHSLSEALEALLSQVAQELGCCLGEAWIPDRLGEWLHMEASWNSPLRECSIPMGDRAATLSLGCDLAGRVLAKAEAEWIDNLAEVPTEVCASSRELTDAGVQTLWGLPIDDAGTVVAVLVFGMAAGRGNASGVLNLATSALRGVGKYLLQQRTTDELRILSLAVKQSPVSIVVTDKEGSIEYVNPRFCQVTGYGMDELLGKNPRVLKSGNLLPSFYRELWDTILSGKRWVGTFVNKKKDGSEYVEDAAIAPILRDDGAITHFVGVKEDVTERIKTTERLMESERQMAAAKAEADAANRAKSSFLATMSHEIRTPMNAILGLSHLTLKTPLDEKQRRYVEGIKDSVESLLGIVEDILDFSKVEAGKMSLENKPFSYRSLLSQLTLSVTLKARSKGLSLRFDVDPAIPDTLEGDQLRLRQVLTNLLDNAIKFTSNGGAVLRLHAVQSSGESVVVAFSVQDTGIGIQSSRLSRLFTPFEQADLSTARRYGGTGLGLSISARLVELMGGHLEVESTPGEGSLFHFQISLGSPEGTSCAQRLGASPLSEGPLALMGDDDERIAELRGYLEGLGVLLLRPQGDLCLEGAGVKAALFLPLRHPQSIQRCLQQESGCVRLGIGVRVLAEPFGCGDEAARLLDSFRGTRVAPISTPADLLDGLLASPAPEVLDQQGATLSTDEPVISPGSGLSPTLRGRILVVEDSSLNLMVVQELLGSDGYETVGVDRGKLALFELERAVSEGRPFDLILMDLWMPEMGGLETARAMRALDPSLSLPIIGMSADARSGVEDAVMQAGMNDFIRKPLHPKDLFVTVAKWIRCPIPSTGQGATLSASTSVRQDDAEGPERTAPSVSLGGVDVAGGLDAVGGDPSFYAELLEEFLRKHGEAPGLLRAALDAAKDEASFREARLLAHTLKGVAGLIYARRLSQLAASIETSAAHGVRDEESMTLFDAEFHVVVGELKAYLSGTKGAGSGNNSTVR